MELRICGGVYGVSLTVVGLPQTQDATFEVFFFLVLSKLLNKHGITAVDATVAMHL